ncbi:MAG: glycosyltransferase family 39 protein [Anaerolineae bacterium]|nr:glycosyltransferase family 39 protein [Anaerolineae bacterium]
MREPVALESLTLAQLCRRLLRHPRRTLAGLRLIVTESPEVPPEAIQVKAPEKMRSTRNISVGLNSVGVALILKLLALALILWGSHELVPVDLPRDNAALARAAQILLPGLVLWLVADLLSPWPQPAPGEKSPDAVLQSGTRCLAHARRKSATVLAVLCSLLAWRYTAGNTFTLVGLFAWVGSIALWHYALMPASLPVRECWRKLRRIVRGRHWQSVDLPALCLVLLLASGIRLFQLDEFMPEMTSDHVEKIRDAWRVSQGNYNVFFANIGGREPFQMYAMALLAQGPGLGFDFYTLKLLTALEGIVAVLLIVWATRTVVGNRAGWLAGALVATSYWHVILSRMGLRIVLTTAVAALAMGFLWRALRDKRRQDFLAVGLVTGFGFYTYQATRMLPAVVIAAATPILLFSASGQRLSLLRNLAALVIVAFAVFVPLGSYALEAPQEFWHRTTSRILGDEAAGTGAENELQALLADVPVALGQLLENIRNALLMFNWKGDFSWFNGAPGRPSLDPWTGALFLVGLVAWGRRIQRERSVLSLMVPLMLLVMLLPSALALNFPHENPSHTRASGALPAVFLIAALPLAQLTGMLRQQLHGRLGQICAAGRVLLFVGGGLNASQRRFYVEYRRAWDLATFPYSTAGQVLASFVDVNNAPGNAFVVAWPFWWDHRAVGIEAGLMDWPNGLLSGDRLQDALAAAIRREGPYQFNAEAGLLFFLSPEDEASLGILQNLFPSGLLEHRQSDLERFEFLLNRVPPLDEATRQHLLNEKP